MVTITYFVHGTTTDNEQGLATGWLPGELSTRGIEQSRALPTQIEGKTFFAVISSDLLRARQTAHLSFGGRYHVIEDSRLREANYGAMNGKHKDLLGGLEQYIDTPFPNGESYRDVETRMRHFCESLRANYDGKSIALVAHQAPQLALDVILGGKTWHQAIAEDWRHTGVWQPGWVYTIAG